MVVAGDGADGQLLRRWVHQSLATELAGPTPFIAWAPSLPCQSRICICLVCHWILRDNTGPHSSQVTHTSKDLMTYLKGRDREREGKMHTRERALPSPDLLSKWPHWPGRGQAQVRAQKPHLSLDMRAGASVLHFSFLFQMR